MRPYFDDGQITIFNADCRDILPTLDAGSVDLILADPPYSETSLAWDALVDGWLPMVERVLNASGSLWCFGSFKSFMLTRDDFAQGWKHAQEIVWEKHNGSIFHADRFRRVHELFVQFYPTRNRWSEVYKNPQFTNDATKQTLRRKTRPAHSGNIGDSVYVSQDGGPKLMRSVQYVRSCHGYAVHPTQKPEGIVRPVLAYSLPPGGLLVDPFAGSGTSLVVAREMGARAIGIELSEAHCANAVKRLQQTVLPLEVADAAAPAVGVTVDEAMVSAAVDAFNAVTQHETGQTLFGTWLPYEYLPAMKAALEAALLTAQPGTHDAGEDGDA